MDESVIKHLERQQVGTMKLSHAIKEGSKIRPQCYGALAKQGKTCALGAAYEFYFGELPQDGNRILDYFRLRTVWPELGRPYGPNRDLEQFITMLADCAMTREQVADEIEAQGY